MKNRKWYKWNYLFCHKCSHTGIENYLERKNLLSTWSEHFRRVEIKSTKKVPKSVIEEKIRFIKSDINHLKSELKEIKEHSL